MKILKSTTTVMIIALVVASIYGMAKGLALLCLCLGARECIGAKECHDRKQKKMAFASLVVGILACVCALLSITNLI